MEKRYLEEIFQMYKEQKKSPFPEINVKDLDINIKEINIPNLKKASNSIEPNLEFGEVYYFVDKRNIPIFFMINGLVEESRNNLYSVYKVSDFIDFATQKDFIFEINGLSYMVETWNEFYLYEDTIKDALFIGKLPKKDLYLLQDVLDGFDEIPTEKRGLTIPEEGNYVQYKFQEEEMEDVLPYKSLIFEIFDDIEQQEELGNVIYLPPERLERQLLAAAHEQTAYIGSNFTLFYEEEENKIILEVDDKNLIGKKAIVEILGDKYSFDTLPESIDVVLPEEFKGKVNIKYIGETTRVYPWED